LKIQNLLSFRREIVVSWWPDFLWLSVGIWHANTHTHRDQHLAY